MLWFELEDISESRPCVDCGSKDAVHFPRHEAWLCLVCLVRRWQTDPPMGLMDSPGDEAVMLRRQKNGTARITAKSAKDAKNDNGRTAKGDGESEGDGDGDYNYFETARQQWSRTQARKT